MTEITTPELGEKEPLLNEDGEALAVGAKAQSNEDEEAEDDTDDAPTRSGRDSSSRRRQFVFLALFLFVAWLAYAVRVHLAKKQKPQIIYASRYSKELKYRPAASPIITETLKDGRIRLRGATPPPATPTPTPTTRKRRTRKRKSGTKKRAASGRP